MRVIVSAGRAWILGTSISYQGAYNFVNDAPVDINIAASSTINPRKDIIIARIQDAAVSGAVNSATLEVVTGTASPSPALPSVPSNSIVLAVVLVAANASAIVTANIDTTMVQVATLFSQMRSDTTICTSTTRPTGGDRYVGARILETDTLREWMWDGTNWAYRGGGPAPRTRISTTASMVWGNNSGQVYTMAPLAGELDSNYFQYVNGSSLSSGDRIKVKQSGNYLVEVSMFSDHAGIYFSQIEAFYSPALTAFGGGLAGSTPASWAKYLTSRPQYLTAGQEVGVQVYMDNPTAELEYCWLQLTMIP
jgi:hypothetical protein